MANPHIDNMLEALDLEVEEIRNSRTASAYDLIDGIRLEHPDPSLVAYQFQMDNEATVREDSPGELIIAGEPESRYPCLIQSLNGNVVTLNIDHPLGDTIPAARLSIDMTFLLINLKDKLQEIAGTGPKPGFNLALADQTILGAAQPAANPKTSTPDPNNALPTSLNVEQQDAVKKSLEFPVSYLWGPPGTGKTRTVGAIAASYYRAGKSVLVLSHTNVAVDTALEQVCDQLQAEPDFSNGLVLRYGQISKTELDRKYGDCILPKRIAERAKRNPKVEPDQSKNLPVGDKCRIVGCTVYQTYLNQEVYQRGYDAVILDEASMVPLPFVFYVAGLAKERVVVAGDFRQLPPIAQAEGPQVEEWFKKDVFQKSGIEARVDAHQQPPELTALKSQYRMAPQICDLANRMFYGAGLKTDASVMERDSDEFPLGDNSLFYLDTGELVPWSAFRVRSRSRYNPIHALLVRNLVAKLVQANWLPQADSHTADKLAIVAPYAAQPRLISRMVAPLFQDKSPGADFGAWVPRPAPASTVHRFQGNEKNVIVLDLTEAPGTPIGRFSSGVNIGDEGGRLLNVALTRAQNHLAIIADFAYLARHPARDTIANQLLSRIKAEGAPLNARDLLSGAASLPLLTGGFNPASYLADDVRNARQSVVVCSPEITDAGYERWAGTLREKAGAGVPVKVFTKTAPDNRSLARLSDAGITLRAEDNFSARFAMIDQQLLWVSSGDLLGGGALASDTLTVQHANREACLLLASFLGLPSSNRRPTVREGDPCPQCGDGEMRLRRGSRGAFLGCSRYPECRSTASA